MNKIISDINNLLESISLGNKLDRVDIDGKYITLYNNQIVIGKLNSDELEHLKQYYQKIKQYL